MSRLPGTLARMRFAGDLAELVRRPGGERADFDATRRASVKDVAESLGVPHTEIYGLEADGRAVDFGHLPAPGQEVTAFPASPPVDWSRGGPLRSGLPALRFAVDLNVAKLGTLLRALGFDAAGHLPPGGRVLDDRALAALAAREGRVLLSRDRALLKRRGVAWGRLVRAADPLEQLREVLGLFGAAAPAPFRRCLRCNEPLEDVPKSEVLPLLEPKTRRYYEDFSRCPSCGRVYWAGSHQEHMRAALARAGVLPGG